jgi:3-oxoacyl-[acyl-carrier protein] reductase
MPATFTDEVAVVTGGSVGIGKATVELLADRGCRVVLCARSEDDLAAAADDIESDQLLTVPADVTNSDDVSRLVERTIEEFGGVDILVNNAGIIGGMQPFEELSAEDWHEVLNVNLMGTVRVTKAVLPHLRESDAGSIVNVASESGSQPDAEMPHYNASKAGIINLTKSLSKAYGEEGIRVNAVSPATTRTPMVQSMFEGMADEQGMDVEDAEEGFLTEERPHIVLGRTGDPEEIAAVIAFLASEEASFVTGANYRVDGGSVASIDI